MSVRIEIQWNDGVKQDVTNRVLSAEWGWGQLLENHIGATFESGTGSLLMRPEVVHPGGVFDETRTYPGPIVTITSHPEGTLVYRGVSGGIVAEINNRAIRTVNMTFHGALWEIGFKYDQVRSVAEESALSGKFIEQVLNDVGFPADRRIIAPGKSYLNGPRLNRKRVLTSSRGPVTTLHALDTLTQTELGLMYDNRDRKVVFEDRESRPALLASALENASAPALDSLRILDIKQLPVKDSIINELHSEVSPAVSRGEKNITVQPDVPYTLQLNPGQRRYLTWHRVIEADSTTEYVQWNPIPEMSISGVPSIDAGITDSSGDEVTYYFHNGFAQVAVVSITNIKGQPFRPALQERFYATNPLSIERYGRQSERLPLDLIINIDDIKDHLDLVLSKNDGLSTAPRTRYTVDISAQRVDTRALALSVEISDLISLTVPELSINRRLFFVDKIGHSVGSDGAHVATLGLFDSSAYATWQFSFARFGETAYIGF